jgi:hypothetical protein
VRLRNLPKIIQEYEPRKPGSRVIILNVLHYMYTSHIKKKKVSMGQALMAPDNPSYSGGRDQEDHSLKSALDK